MVLDKSCMLSNETLERLEVDFRISFFEQVVETDPEHLDGLLELGHAYTQRGLYNRGLDIDRRLSKLLPTDATVHYNLACSNALVSNPDHAFEALQKAIDLGYKDLRHLLKDSDLKSLRNDERFARIIARLERLDRSIN